MGRNTTAQYSATLKTYAFGVAQDTASKIADFISPRCQVGVGVGQYKKFDDKNAFQIYDTSRALGGKATRIKFEATDPTYNCKPNALEAPIDDTERNNAGDAQTALEEAKTRTLVVNAAASREKKVIDLVKDSVAAVANKGVWSGAASDPIDELDEQIESIATATGMMPNAMVLGLGAWRVLKNHPSVIKRMPGAQVAVPDIKILAGFLLNPQIEIRVGLLSRDTTKFGKDKAAVNIVGAECFIFLRSENPTQYDPSFSKTFSIGATGVEDVYTYREEPRCDILAVDWSEDTQVVSTACARRISIS